MNTQLPSSLDYPTQLKHIQANMKRLTKSQPDTMQAFGALNKVSCAPGALGAETKELIALAIAVVARCDGCIALHTHDVPNVGTSRQGTH